MSSNHVLYLTRNGLLEPLGQSQIWPYLCGLSRYCRLTIVSFEKRQDRLNFVTFHQQRLLCKKFGVRWIYLCFRYRPPLVAAFFGIAQMIAYALTQWICLDRPKLVHARSYVSAFVALVLVRLTGVPFIFDMRALWLEELIASGRLTRGSFLHRFLIALERLCLREASGVVSLTHAGLRHLQALYPTELTKARLAVIPTCVDLDRFRPQIISESSTPVYGCIGTVLSGWFQIHWLAAWLEAMAVFDPLARFEIVSRDDPDAIRSALNSSSSVLSRLFITSASPADMPSLLQRFTASAMFFNPGLSKLGSCPTRLAEVLACGRPVVANPGVGDVDSIVGKRRVGVLVASPERQAMEASVHELHALLDDQSLPSRCRSTAEQLFSLEEGIAAYRQLYADILA
jgi:glycosyltransferase involved in cell wall biosynthesis